MPKKIKAGGGSLPLRKVHDADEAAAVDLNSNEALARAGFAVDNNAQQRFISRIGQGLYSVPRLVVRPEVLPLGGVLACLTGAGLRMAVGDVQGGVAAGLAAAGHAVFLALGLKRSADRRRREGDDDPRAAFDDGELKPRLGEDERLLQAVDVPAPRDRGIALSGAGLFQVIWGLLLGGLPLALGGAAQGTVGLLLTAVATMVGTGVFGRGLRALVSLKPVRRLVLTDQRVVMLAAPGAARSIYLDELRHRPVLVARGEGRATLAIDIRPQEALAPLPLMGLVGVDDVDEEEGQRWAADVMDARRAVLEGRE
jgi:hypothetical protein